MVILKGPTNPLIDTDQRKIFLEFFHFDMDLTVCSQEKLFFSCSAHMNRIPVRLSPFCVYFKLLELHLDCFLCIVKKIDDNAQINVLFLVLCFTDNYEYFDLFFGFDRHAFNYDIKIHLKVFYDYETTLKYIRICI